MDFSKHIQKADEALRRRNYDFAAELFRQLVDLDPDLFEARAGLRQALKKRAIEKQEGRLLRAMSGALPMSKAKTLHKLGKYEACSRSLEDYLATSPLDEQANLLLGECLEAAGHFRSARAVYEFLAEIAPKNTDGLKRAGAMMYRAGDHAKALEYYERVLSVDPRDQEAHKARKNLSAETALTRNTASGVQHSRDLIKDKEQAVALERAGKRMLSEDDLKAELARLEQRHAEAPSDPDLLVAIADVHERLKDHEAALEFGERALAYRRDSFELSCKVGELKTKVLKKRLSRADGAGDAERAGRLEQELVQHEIADHRRRAELRPGDATLRLTLAKKLVRAGEIDAALAELQKCQGDPRARPDALFLLGQCFHTKGILDLAKKEYELALEGTRGIDERAKEILYGLGTIAESQGHREEARGFFLRIYEVDIGYKDVATKTGASS